MNLDHMLILSIFIHKSNVLCEIFNLFSWCAYFRRVGQSTARQRSEDLVTERKGNNNRHG